MRYVPRILVVDDGPNMLRSLSILLGEEGCEVLTARSGEEALAQLDDDVQLVLCDLSMPGIDGIEVLKRVRARAPETPFILMTAYSTVQSAVEAMRAGAFEYLVKPFTDDDVTAAVASALRQVRPPRRARELRGKVSERLCELVGRSSPMQRLFKVVQRAAETDSTVLITGESGTGKELIARAIHTLSRRRERPFVAVHCAALSESLLESELFGHERGAFTGALKTKIGRLEQADGGTLFLDEVGELSPAVQTKLLRALAERSFERVGGLATLHVDLRVVAASNRDLPKAIAEGRFREDLYYRLNVVTLDAPPLRERAGDVRLLAELFVKEKSVELRTTPRRLSPDAIAALEAYDFPGNVRELENLIERAIVFSDNEELGVADLPLAQAGGTRAPGVASLIGDSLANAWPRLSEVVKQLERQLVERARAEWPELPNEEIAGRLGTSRRVLELRLQEFGLKKPK
jgi:DNA-binding NtrC family response regulator